MVPWWKQSFLWKVGAVIPECTASLDSNIHENITFHMMQEVSLHDNMSSTKYPNKGVCHIKSQYVICVQFGKHTFSQASVDHYDLPCVYLVIIFYIPWIIWGNPHLDIGIVKISRNTLYNMCWHNVYAIASICHSTRVEQFNRSNSVTHK
jgi:hypothetical protein